MVAASVITSMPKPGSMVSIRSQSSRVRRLASRTGCAVPTRMACDAVVDAVAEKVEAPGAEALRVERRAELGRQLADVAGDRLGGADRLGEGAARLDQVGRADRLDRLGQLAEGLVEAPAELRAEAQGERRARLREQVADPLEAEDAQVRRHRLRQPEGCQRQGRQHRGAMSGRRDEGRPRGMAGQRMSGAPAVGDGRAGGDAGQGQPRRPARRAWPARRHADGRLPSSR